MKPSISPRCGRGAAGLFGIILFGGVAAPPSQATTLYWDTAAGAGNGVGGSGTWSSASTNWSTTTTGDATLVAAVATDALVFQGTAGTMTVSGAKNAASWTVNTTGYTFASSGARNLQGPITLANSVNLTLAGTVSGDSLGFNSSTTGTSGGTGSAVTLANTLGAFTLDLRNTSFLGASAPIIITASGAATSTTIGNSTGTGYVNATIANSSSVPLTLASGVSGATSGTLVVNGKISGTQAVIFSTMNGGATFGRIELSAANDYTGETRFNGVAGAAQSTTVGLVKLTTSNAISTVSNVIMGYSSGKGENLDLAGKNQALASLTSNAGGTGSIFNSAVGTSTLTISGAATTGSFGLAISDGADATRKVALTRSGTGTTTLTNTSTYSGATTVTGGKLVIDGNISTSSLTSVSGTGTLGGSGTVGAATILAGGTLAPGNSIGTLNFSQTLTLAGTSNFEVDPTLGLGLNADRANVASGVTYGGTLNVTYAGLSTDFANGMMFNLFDAGSFAGTFATLNLPTLAGGLTWQNDLASNGSITVVPEPPAAMVAGGLGLLALLRRRRI